MRRRRHQERMKRMFGTFTRSAREQRASTPPPTPDIEDRQQTEAGWREVWAAELSAKDAG